MRRQSPVGRFDLFATEGGTAAMGYIFTTLKENKLLHPGDNIALGTPIFTPYLEIPHLNDYELMEVEVMRDENDDWQCAQGELEKLADPNVKAFFLVNPSNPPSVSIGRIPWLNIRAGQHQAAGSDHPDGRRVRHLRRMVFAPWPRSPPITPFWSIPSLSISAAPAGAWESSASMRTTSLIR